MTRDDVIAELGGCKPVESDKFYDVIRCCNEPRAARHPDKGPLLNGKQWSWGYAPAGVDPREIDHDWAALAAAIRLARELEAQANEAGLCQSSEADIPFQALVVKVDGDGDPLEKLRASMGIGAAEEMVRVEVEDPAQDLFFAADTVDELEEYYEDDDVAVYRSMAAKMAAALSDLIHVTFDPYESCDGLYVVSPEIYVGEKDGYFVGLWSYIVRT